MTPAPGATMIVASSPASRPSPPGGLRPALTPAAGDTGMHRSGAASKEDQQNKIHLTEVSTVSGDCRALVRQLCQMVAARARSAGVDAGQGSAAEGQIRLVALTAGRRSQRVDQCV